MIQRVRYYDGRTALIFPTHTEIHETPVSDEQLESLRRQHDPLRFRTGKPVIPSDKPDSDRMDTRQSTWPRLADIIRKHGDKVGRKKKAAEEARK